MNDILQSHWLLFLPQQVLNFRNCTGHLIGSDRSRTSFVSFYDFWEVINTNGLLVERFRLRAMFPVFQLYGLRLKDAFSLKRIDKLEKAPLTQEHYKPLRVC